MEIFSTGEKVHIVEKRIFADDLRRHFVGVVKQWEDNLLRITGYVWVFSAREAKFIRRPELRERVIVLGDRHIINILPANVHVSEIVYNSDNSRQIFITDKKQFRLELSEFVNL